MATASPSPWRSVAALCTRLNEGSDPPTFTDDSIRHLLRHAATNGLGEHVRRLGAKIVINEEGFLGWLNAQPRRSATRRGRR